MNRYFFDTEFIEDGTTIDLVSIGIVSDSGREYYAVSLDADLRKANEWVQKNVLPHLPSRPSPLWRTREEMRRDIVDFVGAESRGRPEFWAYFASYDWVALCQLFGRMIDLPKDWPMRCNDLMQWASMIGAQRAMFPSQKGQEHDALEDARWNRRLFEYLSQLPLSQLPQTIVRPG